MDDPWGLADPPAPHEELPLPARLAQLAALTGPVAVAEDDPLWAWPAAPELPEVQALMADGWYPLDAAPLHGLLPTVWPREHRCWVPDRLPRIAHRTDGITSFLAPSRRHRHAAPDELVQEQAIEAGLPLPPAGRIWLLRSPFPAVVMQVLLRLVWLRSLQLGQDGRPFGSPSAMVEAVSELVSWSEDELLSWWTGKEADAPASGPGSVVLPRRSRALVVRGLGPDEVQPLLDDGLTEREIGAWHDVLAGTGRPLVETVRLWRGRGVDLRQTSLLTRLVWLPEEEIAEWTDAGFEYAAMVQLAAVPLMRAIEWRDAGYEPAQTVALLRADELISPAEAQAFAAAGTGLPVHGAVGRVRLRRRPGRRHGPRSMYDRRRRGSGVRRGVADRGAAGSAASGRLPGRWLVPAAGRRPSRPRPPGRRPPGTRGRVARERREQVESNQLRQGRQRPDS